MKFLCPACDRLLEPSSYRIEADDLIVQCARCGTETSSRAQPAAVQSIGAVHGPPRLALAPEAPPVEQSSFDAPPGFCPKCLSPRPERAESCTQCGLVFANHQPGEFQPSEEVATQWREVLAHWTDLKKHDQFLKSMLAQTELVSAGRLYRLRLALAPSDAMAQRGRDEVVRLATLGSAMFTTPSGGAQRVFRWQHLAVGIFILLCIVIAVVLFRQVALRLP